MEIDDVAFGVEDVDFDEAFKVLTSGFGGSILGRFERIREVVDMEEIIHELHPRATGHVFSCPFHGRDSRPSFYFYRSSNSAWCFGCPLGSQLYTPVEFVAAKFGITKMEAVKWLEKKYNLPPLEDEEEDFTDLGDGTIEVRKVLTFDDIRDAYLEKAGRHVQETQNPELFFLYAARFFNALPEQMADPNSDEEVKKTLSLARLLDPATLDKILGAK
jgi:hypothetical protein